MNVSILVDLFYRVIPIQGASWLGSQSGMSDVDSGALITYCRHSHSAPCVGMNTGILFVRPYVMRVCRRQFGRNNFGGSV